MLKGSFRKPAQFKLDGILKKFAPSNFSEWDIDLENEKTDPSYTEKKREMSFSGKKNIKKLAPGMTQLRKKLAISEKERGVLKKALGFFSMENEISMYKVVS